MSKPIYLSKKVEKFAAMLAGLDIRDLRALANECNAYIDAAIGEVRRGSEPIDSASNGSIPSAARNATED